MRSIPISWPTRRRSPTPAGPRWGRPLGADGGDLELALRYLDGFSVAVVAEPLEPSSLEIVAEAAAYAGATLVVLAPGGADPGPIPDRAVVLEAPAIDPDGVFARTVGAFAAAVDAGTDPALALEAAAAAEGWQRAEG